MPILSTDDQARRIRYIWLGPRGFRLPEARFPAWGLFVFVTFLLCALSFALAPPGTRLAVLGCIIAPLIALPLTRLVMRYVDHDRPLRYWMNVVVTELDTPRPLDPATHDRTVSMPRDLFSQGTSSR